MTLFTIKYAPKNSHQIFGQDKAVTELKDFILNYKQKLQRATLLLGPIGCGKTSSVYALAKELKYDLLEINSSDLRNEEKIRTFLDAALGQRSLFFTPKLILIDEVDNISGVHDRGCIPALLKAMEKSTFPIILTANDLEDSKFKPLKKATRMIEYHKLEYRTIAHALQWVCEQEGIRCEERAVHTLARQADGDMRAALLDLHSLKLNFSLENVATLSDRKRTDTILNALRIIFKSSTVENVLPVLDNIDLELKDVMFWIDENLPREYPAPKALAKAYEVLARADVFQGRISKRQHWRFLVYINNLLTAGISAAKDEKNPEFISYRQTMRFLRMWQAKIKWGKRKDLAAKVAAVTHTSKKVALQQMPYYEMMIKKNPAMAEELKLDEEEVGWVRR